MSDNWITNRQKKREPKQGRYWCGKCDANLIHDGERCGHCKGRIKSKRNKKASTINSLTVSFSEEHQ